MGSLITGENFKKSGKKLDNQVFNRSFSTDLSGFLNSSNLYEAYHPALFQSYGRLYHLNHTRRSH